MIRDKYDNRSSTWVVEDLKRKVAKVESIRALQQGLAPWSEIQLTGDRAMAYAALKILVARYQLYMSKTRHGPQCMPAAPIQHRMGVNRGRLWAVDILETAHD